MAGNPKDIPRICGIVRVKPNVAPDDVTIVLLGPGVADIDMANATADENQMYD